MLKRFFLLLFSVCSFTSLVAQETIYWPSPEVAQMYKQAKEYLSRGAIQQATILLQQAIQIAPDVSVLHRDLSQAFLLSGNFDESYKIIEPIIKSGQADEISFQIAASALTGKGEQRQTKKTIEKGLKAFPNSGLLYNQLGKYYEGRNDPEYALDSWLKGIQVDPVYHLNYYDAARTFASTTKPVWAIIYGEIFCNLERQTQRSLEVRKMILEAYKKMVASLGTKDVPKYGQAVTNGEEETFEAAVMHVYLQLAPVVSDGITADNLTMLRARFVMDWLTTFGEQYHFSLFTYQDRMLRDGVFDAYNQWLFGAAENEKLYQSWQMFHPDALSQFEVWARSHPYKPTAGDYYNTTDLRKLFSKKKKK